MNIYLFYAYVCIMTILRAFMLNKIIKYGKNIYVLAYSTFCIWINKCLVKSKTTF
jgi:hypothetical protein